MSTPEETIRTHIAQNILFSKAYPHPDEASFLEEGIIDSMNVMELILFVEEKFGVEVTDDEIVPDNFDSVARIANFVRRKSAVATEPTEHNHEHRGLFAGSGQRQPSGVSSQQGRLHLSRSA